MTARLHRACTLQDEAALVICCRLVVRAWLCAAFARGYSTHGELRDMWSRLSLFVALVDASPSSLGSIFGQAAGEVKQTASGGSKNSPEMWGGLLLHV